MLHDDHVFSDNLTEEELEKLLAELDKEDSENATVNNVEPTLEQRLSSAKNPNTSHESSEELVNSQESEDWIAKLLEDEDDARSSEEAVDEIELQAMVAEINQNIAHKDSSKIIETMGDSENETIATINAKVEEPLTQTPLATEGTLPNETAESDLLDIELLDEADLAKELAQASVSNTESDLIEDDLIIDNDFENFELSEEFLIDDIEPDQSAQGVDNPIEMKNTDKGIEPADTNALEQETVQKDASHYDVDSFLDTSLLKSNYSDSNNEVEESADSIAELGTTKLESDSVDTPSDTAEEKKTNELIIELDNIDNTEIVDENIAEETTVVSDLSKTETRIEDINRGNQLAPDKVEGKDLLITTKVSPHLDTLLKSEANESKEAKPTADEAQQETFINDGNNTNAKNVIEQPVVQQEKLNEQQFLKVSEKSQDTANKIQNRVKEIKEQVRRLQDTFRELTDSSAEMIAETRQLQNMCKDDFSVTYEQMHQLRSLIIQTCSDIGDIPSMVNIVEEAMESDLYVAETRSI